MSFPRISRMKANPLTPEIINQAAQNGFLCFLKKSHVDKGMGTFTGLATTARGRMMGTLGLQNRRNEGERKTGPIYQGN